MPSIVAEGGKAWDFGPVYDLLHNLSSQGASSDSADSNSNPIIPSPNTHARPVSAAVRNDSEGLGDFRAIWDFMGVDPKAPPPKISPRSPSPLPRRTRNDSKHGEPNPTPVHTSSDITLKDAVEDTVLIAIEKNKDYTSDGAIYGPKKGVRWRTEPELSDLGDQDTAESEIPADTSADEAGSGKGVWGNLAIVPNKPLSKAEKQQAKREKRIIREQHWRKCAARKGITDEQYAKLTKKQKRQMANQDAKLTQQTKAVSDAEPEKLSNKQTPAKKASAHQVVNEPATPTPAPRYNLRSGASLSTSPTKQKQVQVQHPTSPTKQKRVQVQQPTTPKVNSKKSKNTEPLAPEQPIPHSEPQPEKINAGNQPAVPSTEVRPSKFAVTNFDQSPLLDKSQKPSTLPPHLPTPKSLPSQGPLIQYQLQAPSLHPMNIPPSNQTPRVLAPAPQLASTPGFVMRYGEDRHLHFLLQLINQFPDDRKWLVAPAQMANHNNNATGIHVFVDASNIFIGFKEYMRRSFGLPLGKQAQGLEISFDSLVLLMERRRPVAKRVLVGSYPNLPAFDMAKAVGYETNILDQVYKNKDVSKSSKKHIYIRQSSKAMIDALGPGAVTPSVATPSTPVAGTSASASNGPLMARKWVEQGVDEILHLKMLESVVDADEPGTMVLATGDAAVAEYSQGFLKMVERALKKGWCVELLSWRNGMNQAYLNRNFRQQWGERFLVTELDAWAGDLVDT